MAGHFVRGGVQHNILQQREEEQKRKLFGDTPDTPDENKVSASGWGTVNKTDNSSDHANQAINSKFSQYTTDTSDAAVAESQDKTLEKYQEKLAEASVRLTQKATAKIIKEAEERQRDRNNAWMDRSAYNEEMARRRYGEYGYDSYQQAKNFEKYTSAEGYITHPKTGFRYRPRKFDDKMNHTESRGWLHRISSLFVTWVIFYLLGTPLTNSGEIEIKFVLYLLLNFDLSLSTPMIGDVPYFSISITFFS